MDKRFTIAIDAMGGDYAPEEIIKGAIMAADAYDLDIVLVGPRDILRKHLDNYSNV
ncbi:MAG: phosphate acyltransferase, partial [Chloroflexota bacterium]|nr:phosphate acyltransferase [Chloroflexota bacterium]